MQEGYSIRGQTEKLKSYALLKEWDIFDIYADEGISGKNIVDCPAINRLIEDIESGKVNNVLVFKVDRLTRSTKNLLELVELFEDCNCAFNSLTESIDTDTPSGRMFLKIIGIFAEFERENLVTRLKLGFERKVKEGYTLASQIISYGYQREKGQKIQIIHPDESKIVKEIFSIFLDKNISFNGIENEIKGYNAKRTVGFSGSGCTKGFTFMKLGIPPPSVTLNKSTLTMNINDTETLTSTVVPLNAVNKSVTWTSSNPDIATVSTGGVVTALNAGTTTITVKTTDGSKTATCTVTVSRSGDVNLQISEVNATENGGWLEITNSTNETLTTRGLYLSNDYDIYKWQMPAVIIRPNVTVRICTNSNNTDKVLKRMLINFDIEVGGMVRLSNVAGNVLSEFEVK